MQYHLLEMVLAGTLLQYQGAESTADKSYLHYAYNIIHTFNFVL